jgi:hypothetical protein
VAGSREYGDEPAGYGATELVSYGSGATELVSYLLSFPL